MKTQDPRTIATMAHGRITIQAWKEPGVLKYERLHFGVNGTEIDTDKLDPKADPDHATLIGFFKMASEAHHVGPPWRLTDYGKELAGECPCGPCTWEDPPVREKRKPTPPKAVPAKERRRLRRERQRKIDAAVAAQLEAQARRIRELELEAAEQRQRRQARLVRLEAELRQERERREAAEAELAAARREKRREAARAAMATRVRGPGGRFVKGAK